MAYALVNSANRVLDSTGSGNVTKAFAGNNWSPSFVKSTNGDYYVWDNDESQHGPQRWHIINARAIREIVGSGPAGSEIDLTNQAYAFPTAVTGIPGNQSCILSGILSKARLHTMYDIRSSTGARI